MIIFGTEYDICEIPNTRYWDFRIVNSTEPGFLGSGYLVTAKTCAKTLQENERKEVRDIPGIFYSWTRDFSVEWDTPEKPRLIDDLILNLKVSI